MPQHDTDANLTLLYNFTYRLTGNIHIAEAMTREVILSCPGAPDDAPPLLKAAWHRFLLCYSQTVFKSEDELQQRLLKLMPGERGILILRDILGLPLEVIAGITGYSAQEAAGLLAEGRRSLCRQKMPAANTA